MAAEPSSLMTCPECGTSLADNAGYQRQRVCDRCRHHFPVTARERLAQLVDEGTFREVNSQLVSVDPLTFADHVPYRQRLAEAQQRTGLQEAVITGIGSISGCQAVLAISDFRFLGGSMGSVVGEKITLALELAGQRRLPFVAICSSGGARMQEGMLSLVQMAKTAAAAMRLHQRGVPMVCVLTDPTTGGVYASYASQGDIVLAEPGALIGFAGPRVIAETTGQRPPKGTHTAEFLLEHGLVDRVLDRSRLRGTLAIILQLLQSPFQLAQQELDLYRPQPSQPSSAWEEVELARHPERPSAEDYVHRLIPQFVDLRGDRMGGDDPALLAGIGYLEGVTLVVIAQERRQNGGRVSPTGYRKAIRMMRLAARLRLPILTLIDTPGATMDYESEAQGLAQAISNCMSYLSAVPVPVVAVVIGEGGSGGALALGVADRIFMQQNAVYEVIAPEGAAAILYRTAERAREVAQSLKLTAYDCQQLGVVDTVVPEPDGGAHQDPDYAALQLRNHLLTALAELRRIPPRRLVNERYRKFRRLGQYSEALQGEAAGEVQELGKTVARAFGHLLDRLHGLPAEPEASVPDAEPASAPLSPGE